MLVIADNLNVRNKAYREAVKKKDRKAIEAMAKELAAKGADIGGLDLERDNRPAEERPCPSSLSPRLS